jgi:DHA3 family macrolide efflux protein-like MFS transporter
MNSSTPAIPERWAPRFFTIWGGQAVSLFGSALVQFALVWYLTQETGSATVLAMASLAAMLPQVLIGPFAGVWVDRGNRRLIMIGADGLIALTTLGLAILFALGTVQVWQIYLAMMIRSLCGAFHYPAMTSSTSLMVPNEHLARVAGLNQTLQGLMSIVAPPVGALLVSIMPTQGVLMIDVGTAIIGMAPLLFLSVPQPVRKDLQAGSGAPRSTFWSDAREGLRFIVSWRGLLIVCIMATMLNFLLTPTGALMPLLVTQHFGQGALALGLTQTLEGVGMIVAGLVLGAWGGFKRKIATSLMGITGVGIGVLLIGLAPANMFGLALAAMFIVGTMIVFANGPLQALFQTVVPAEKQGRVLSLVGSVATAMSPLGLLVAGPLSDRIGIQTWYLVSGVVCVVIAAAGFFIPAVMDIENNHRSAETDKETEPAGLPGISGSVRD